jgi:hypothetical protein
LRPFQKNDDKIFPKCKVWAFHNFSDAKDKEWLVDDILAHKWEGNKVSFLLQWNLGDTTWEPYTECKDLVALHQYLELLGIDDEDWKKLTKKSSRSKQMSKGSTADAPLGRTNQKRT